MKKSYINPTIEIIKIASKSQMLAGSPDGKSAVDPTQTVDPVSLEGHDGEFDW